MNMQVSSTPKEGAPPQGPYVKRAFNPAGVVAAVSAFVLVFTTLLLSQGFPNPVSTPPQDVPAPVGDKAPVQVEVRAQAMAFSPNLLEVPAHTPVEITFINDDSTAHDLVTDLGPKTELVAPGQSAKLLLPGLDQPVSAWCSVPGHRQSGMTMKISPQAGGQKSSSEGAASGNQSTGAHSHHGSGSTVAADVPGMSAFLQDPSEVYIDPVLPKADDKRVREFTFVVTETEIGLGAGVKRPIWTFNGGPVGPTLRGKLGDKFVITLKNEGTMAHSIDFHASYLAPDVPMRSIEPGESLVYEFTAQRAGIWMYHCGTAPMTMHIATGMHGAVVIDPPDLEPVDYEYVFVQSEIYLPSADSPVDPQKLRLVQPDLMAFNGVPYQYRVKPIEVPVGKKVRAWVIAIGPNLGTSFHVVGSQFDTTWAEGRFLLKDGVDPVTGKKGGGSQALGLTAAQGGYVEFALPEAGNYPFLDHSIIRAEQGAIGIFRAK
ncbi:multicopper oxidase domain-containing protein [Gleimia sp. 6138-11-ORH1]|uniref:multicopper oxidase domain-containing protein n=1 Tax=Gleimia sp. 6138-11-ORH1 TaxID=2973937 RepID=UPI0021680781|nr:multicopper oxidase domain-containing protein [Gleimia sp. 6138-11-ORH1]MCS4485166.1 multicopper oxidase domain-containing protein [Gleimia sp. 6138-11-ORH1]